MPAAKPERREEKHVTGIWEMVFFAHYFLIILRSHQNPCYLISQDAARLERSATACRVCLNAFTLVEFFGMIHKKAHFNRVRF